MLKASWIGRDISKTLERFFRGFPLHPNVVTVFSGVCAVAGYAAYEYSGWASLAVFLFALLLDALDGVIARARQLETKKGAFLDGVIDRFVEFVIVLTLLKMGLPTLGLESGLWVLLLLFFGTCMTSFIKAYSEHSGVVPHARAKRMGGVLERAERTLLVMVVFVLGLLQNPYANVVLAITAILAFATCVQRVWITLESED